MAIILSHFNYWQRQQTYHAYLRSKPWRTIAARIMERDAWQCQLCYDDAEEVHHITYDNIFREEDDDLVALCSDCHEMVHAEKWAFERQIRAFRKNTSDQYRLAFEPDWAESG